MAGCRGLTQALWGGWGADSAMACQQMEPRGTAGLWLQLEHNVGWSAKCWADPQRKALSMCQDLELGLKNPQLVVSEPCGILCF